MDPLIRDTFGFAAEAVEQTMGEDVVYEGEVVRAVFGSGFTATQSGEIRVSSRTPEISIRKAALAGVLGGQREPSKGHMVKIRDEDYEVSTVMPDAEGVTFTLRLKRRP